MNILLCSNVPFPHGFGASVFMLTLARGMAANGHTVHFVSPWPTESPENCLNTQSKGEAYGVPFCYVCGRTAYPRVGKLLIFYKIWIYFYGLIKLANYITKYSSSNKIDWVITCGGTGYFLIPVWFFCRFFKIFFIQFRGEYPFFGQMIPRSKYLQFWIDQKITYRLADGMLVATRILEDYYRPLAKKNCRFVQIPLITDTACFDKIPQWTGNRNYITYCGHMGLNKDGVEILIQAFSLINLEFPEMKLKLIGTASPRELQKQKELVQTLKIQDKVIFTGQLLHEEVLEHLKNSRLLVLARPNNKQAQGGFPSKVGEYLSTGLPVVVTAVGEVPSYLHDGQSAFLAEPGNVKSLADKLQQALKEKELARTIGKYGQQLAQKHFHYQIVCSRIIDCFCSPSDNYPPHHR